MMNFKKLMIGLALASATVLLAGCVANDTTPDVDGSTAPTSSPTETADEELDLSVPEISGAKPNVTVPLTPATSEAALAVCPSYGVAVHQSEATSLNILDEERSIYWCSNEDGVDTIIHITDEDEVMSLLSAYYVDNESKTDEECATNVTDPAIIWVHSPNVESIETIYAPVDGCGYPQTQATEQLKQAIASGVTQ